MEPNENERTEEGPRRRGTSPKRQPITKELAFEGRLWPTCPPPLDLSNAKQTYLTLATQPRVYPQFRIARTYCYIVQRSALHACL